MSGRCTHEWKPDTRPTRLGTPQADPTRQWCPTCGATCKRDAAGGIVEYDANVKHYDQRREGGGVPVSA